jgi:hypothetical protein
MKLRIVSRQAARKGTPPMQQVNVTGEAVSREVKMGVSRSGHFGTALNPRVSVEAQASDATRTSRFERLTT